MRSLPSAISQYRYPEDFQYCPMDHLPSPVDPVDELLEIPYICCDDDLVVRCCWIHYPEEKGWLLNENGKVLSRASSSSVSEERTSTFVQAWLWFGVLAEVFSACDIALDVTYLVKDGRDGLVLSTKELPRLLDEMNAREQGLPEDFRRKHYERVWKCLDLAGQFFFLLRDNSSVPVYNKVLLANSVLGETLSNAAGMIWSDLHSEQSWFFLPAIGTFDQMMRLGWCRRDVHMLHHLGMGLSSGCYLASRLKSRPQLQHIQCSDYKCLARQFDGKTYKPKHVEEGCDCAFVSVDVDSISSKLVHGLVPRVRVSDDIRTGKVTVKSVGQGSGPYVAITHVWSDGMGNPLVNALPSCQASRLRHLVAAMYLKEATDCQWSAPLWIDTFCIPLEREARKAALNLLVRTYEEADKVLIIDADLAEVPSWAPTEELLVRVRLCGWMRRLWTLEEGVLAGDRLYLQLQDRAINLYDLLTKTPRTLYNRISKELCGTILRDLPLVNRHQTPDLSRFAILLQLRATSKKSDEVLCLASLMGLEIDNMYHLPTFEDKMRWLYRSIGKISVNIMFVKGQKLKRGFGWAPDSFMSSDDIRFLMALDPPPEIKSITGTIDERGLHFALSGAFVDLGLGRQTISEFCFKGPEEDQMRKCTPVKTHSEASLQRRETEYTNLDVAPATIERVRYALIFSPEKLYRDRAALLLVEKEFEAIIFAQYFCLCELENMDISAALSDQDYVVATHHMPATTKWCVK